MYFKRLSTTFYDIGCGGHDNLWGIVDNVHRSIKYALPDPGGDFMWYNAPEFPTTDAVSIDVGTDGTVNVLTASGDLYYYIKRPFDDPREGLTGHWYKVESGLTGNISVQLANVRAGIKEISAGMGLKYYPAVELTRGGQYMTDTDGFNNVNCVAIAPDRWVLESLPGSKHLHLHNGSQQVTIGTEGPYQHLCFPTSNLILAVNASNVLKRYLGEGVWETITAKERRRDKSGKWEYLDVGPMIGSIAATSANRIFLCTHYWDMQKGSYHYATYLSIPDTQGEGDAKTELTTGQTFMDDQSNKFSMKRKLVMDY